MKGMVNYIIMVRIRLLTESEPRVVYSLIPWLAPMMFTMVPIRGIFGVILLTASSFITRENMIAMSRVIVGMVRWLNPTLAVTDRLKTLIRLLLQNNWPCLPSKPMTARGVMPITS